MRTPLIFATCLTALAAGIAQAAPVGTLLFAQDGVQIINPQGQARPARQGDMLEPGERLITPDNAASQIRLLDGSLVGVRPGSELTVNLPETAAGVAQQVISLLSGKVRVIGGELIGGKPAPVMLNAGESHLQLKGADLEASVVPKAKSQPDGGVNSGSYARLLVGTAQLNVGAAAVPLAPREINFVAAGALPVLAAISPGALFSDPRTMPGGVAGSALRTAATPDAPAAKPPTLTLDPKVASIGDPSRFAALSPTRSTLTSVAPPPPATLVPNTALIGPVTTKLPSLQPSIQPIATVGALPPPPVPTLPPIAIVPPLILQPVLIPIIKPVLLLPTCRLILGQMICS